MNTHWKSAINSVLGRVGYRVTKFNPDEPESKSEDIAGSIAHFAALAALISDNWAATSGHDVIRAISPLAGHPIPYGKEEFPHAFFFSVHNTYAPWLRDKELQRWAEVVRPPRLLQPDSQSGESHTLVDIYRCWTIWQVAKQLGPLAGDMIEIGAYRGGTAALIAHAITISNQQADLFVCDTFNGVVKAGSNDTAYQGGEHADTTVSRVHELVGRFLDPSRIHIEVGVFPEDIGSALSSKLFKFAHIDVDVYQSALDCVRYLWPMLVTSGVIIFDDYGLQGTEGMTKAAEELAATYENAMLVYNFSGQAMLVKLSTP